MYETTVSELKKNGDFSESDSLSRAIAQQSYYTAEDIATITYSELDILDFQLQSITMKLPLATSGRQECQIGLIFGIAGTQLSSTHLNTLSKLQKNSRRGI